MPDPATPIWDVARSPAPSRHILETARQHGLDDECCLSGTGLTLEDLADPATEVRAGQELTIIRNVIGRLGDLPGLGMESGSHYTFADTGILGYALLSSPTVGDAINVACRYAVLTTTYLSLAAPRLINTEAAIAFDLAQVPRMFGDFSSSAISRSSCAYCLRCWVALTLRQLCACRSPNVSCRRVWWRSRT